MIYTGGHLLKEKMDLAFDEEIADIKEHIKKNEKISLFEFFFYMSLMKWYCGYYNRKKESDSFSNVI